MRKGPSTLWGHMLIVWSELLVLTVFGIILSQGREADFERPGIHLAKVDLKTGEVKSNWTNLWNGTGGLVSAFTSCYIPLADDL